MVGVWICSAASPKSLKMVGMGCALAKRASVPLDVLRDPGRFRWTSEGLESVHALLQ